MNDDVRPDAVGYEAFLASVRGSALNPPRKLSPGRQVLERQRLRNQLVKAERLLKTARTPGQLAAANASVAMLKEMLA